MEQMLTCINCPVGCQMTVSISDEGKFVSVSGNNCKRGAIYAEQEVILPKRMITAVIPVKGSKEPLSVKTSVPIPKEMIWQVMKALGELDVFTPIIAGQVLIKNVFESGADIVATKEIK